MTIGKTRWAIAEGYIPPDDPTKPREFISHEAACLLNATDKDAHVRITVYFSDREPTGPYEVVVGAQRTQHLRFNDLHNPEPIPRGTDFSSVIESDIPIVVQHTRLDGRKGGIALMSTTAYSES